jgi:hypothetical protein
MSKIITEREIDMMTNQPDNAGVSVFGNAVVADAVRDVARMLPQELRQFAEQLNCANADNANRLIDLLITTPLASPDPARHERIRAKMLKSIMTVTDEEVSAELADERMMEESNYAALLAAAQ